MTRFRPLAACAVLALLSLLASCGSDDQSGPASGPTSTGSGAAAGGPVTIEHRFGATTLEAKPQRIVSLDTAWTDVLVSLGAPLVAAALDPAGGDGRFPWQQDLPSSVEDIPVADAIPYEAVAALRPDLIVITYFAADQATYDLLSQIAPTIPSLGEREVEPWQDIAEVAGRVLDREGEATDLVEESDRLVADLRAELPGLEGKTYALANYVAGDAIHVVADPDDGSSRLFTALGLEIDPDLVALADGGSGRMELSLERIDELDADLLVLLTNGADPAEIPGYAALPAVRSGAVALLDVADVSGLNTPTPLSIPYSLERIRAALEVAAG